MKVLSEKANEVDKPCEINVYVGSKTQDTQKKREPSKWVQFVKQASKELNISYGDALRDTRVKEAYKNNTTIEATPQRAPKGDIVPYINLDKAKFLQDLELKKNALNTVKTARNTPTPRETKRANLKKARELLNNKPSDKRNDIWEEILSTARREKTK